MKMHKRIWVCYFWIICFFLTAFCSHVGAAEKAEYKFSVALYHFNLQYVAGDRKVEDRIVTESLEPLLDFYLKHPKWGGDFEFQGYMVEQLQLRFPKVLEKLKTLIDRRQIELVCFHYADQLFLAYPRWDMDWSQRINQRVFADAGISRSGVVFTQEGQFGEGMAVFMANNNFHTALLPKNLYRYFHRDYKAEPFFKLHGVNVILSGAPVHYEDENAKIDLNWSYCGDAELLPTQNATPYSSEFKYRPDALKKYGEELESLEVRGIKIVTITEYMDALKKLGIPPAELKPVLDGTWQPSDTDNVFRWMGDHRAAFERDAAILTGNFKARDHLAAAEAAVLFLKKQGQPVEELEEKTFTAWKNMMLAEVSDSTGWTPLPVEVRYSQELNQQAMTAADEILAKVKSLMKANFIRIDTKKGTVEAVSKIEEPTKYPEIDCPIKFQLEGDLTDKDVHCYKVSETRTDMSVHFTTKNWYSNDMRLAFPRNINSIVYSPALIDDVVVSYPQDQFNPEREAFYLPSPNGLIGLDENLFLIKHVETVHVAFQYSLKEKTIALRMLHPPNKKYEWQLSIIKGTKEDAVKEAQEINTYPTLTI